MTEPRASSVEEYIGRFPPEVQERLGELRHAIRAAAPAALEKIAYGIPTYVQDGNLVHFGGFKHHVGFYPTPTGIEAFREELAPYQVSKGSVQFPLDQPLPLDLVRRIVEFRVGENARAPQRGGRSG